MKPLLTLYDDLAAFVSDVRGHLEAREAENGLLLGLLQHASEVSLAARLHIADETLGVAYLTPINLVVSRGFHEAAKPLVHAAIERRLDLPGVVGPEEDVDALVEAWLRVRDCRPREPMAQMLYELRRIDWPAGVPGRMRGMTEADVELVAQWVRAFHRDALPQEPYSEEQARANAQARPALGMTYLWEVEGVPVAMAALARPTRHGISVNAVYTPPEHRRRGYASALVAAVSGEGLERGYAFCVLYTDLSNPTSNAIYQKIGYRPVSRSTNVRFSYA